ncbi:MAG TPA: prolipoprotein diacylglyceryl transferase [Spirochaetota bacterium]|nr:prolipoprotein diacylglyceryl transferase [Spirochaetota bacterium]
MFPVIFQYKALTITTFGVLLGLAFYLAFLLLEREMKLRGKNHEMASTILIVAIPSAIIGAKLFHIIDNLEQFFASPKDMILSGDGLSVYGGIIVAFAACYFVVKKYKESYLETADMVAPAVALGYAVGRIGCHVSGDGCFGVVTDSIFTTSYPNGIVPTSIGVFPTPLFESFFSFLVCAFLLNLRKRELPKGTMIFTYMLLNAVARFAVEFIRVNPKVAFSLTQAQIIAIVIFVLGIAGIVYNFRKKQTA